MRKILLYTILCTYLISCSSKSMMDEYLISETLKNNNENIYSVLFSKKSSPKTLLYTFGDPVRKRFGILPKSFNEKEFLNLIEKSKNDTLVKYWTKKNQQQFGIMETLPAKYDEKVLELEKKYSNNLVFYELSEPIIINNGKSAVFLLNKSKGLGKTIEHTIIVLKKENNHWIFVEKINSLAAIN